jgi:hypothetical protein
MLRYKYQAINVRDWLTTGGWNTIFSDKKQFLFLTNNFGQPLPLLITEEFLQIYISFL